MWCTFCQYNTTIQLWSDQQIISTPKVYYYQEIHSRILADMEQTQAIIADWPRKLLQWPRKDALHRLTLWWNQVYENTIKNCFKQGVFIKETIFLEENIQPQDITREEYTTDEWLDGNWWTCYHNSETDGGRCLWSNRFYINKAT